MNMDNYYNQWGAENINYEYWQSRDIGLYMRYIGGNKATLVKTRGNKSFNRNFNA